MDKGVIKGAEQKEKLCSLGGWMPPSKQGTGLPATSQGPLVPIALLSGLPQSKTWEIPQ